MKVINFATHPVQYQVPIYRELSKVFDFKVFYMLEQTQKGQAEAGFGVEFKWDIPLYEGYNYEYLKNASKSPSSSTYNGVVLDQSVLKRVMVKEKPDVVIVHGWFPRATKQIINYCFRNRIIVLSRGDSNLLMPGSRIKKAFKKLYIREIDRKVNAFLCVGKANEEFFKFYDVNPSKLFSAVHSINTDFFQSKFDALPANESKKVRLGFSGKFIDRKQPLLMLNAISQSKYKNQIVVEIVGDGPLKDEVTNLSLKLGLDVNFRGFLNQGSIVEEGYNNMDCLILPSWLETWGLVVNEVMTGGIPVIVSDKVGCAPDLVVEGETGYVFESQNEIDLTRKIDLMVEKLMDPLLKSQMTTSVKKKIENYSLYKTIDGYMNALKIINSEN